MRTSGCEYSSLKETSLSPPITQGPGSIKWKEYKSQSGGGVLCCGTLDTRCCMHTLQAEQGRQKIKSVQAPGGTDEALAPYQLMVNE